MRDLVSSSTRNSPCDILTRATCCTWTWKDGRSREGARAMTSGRQFAAPRHDFVAALFRLIVGDLRRESLTEDPDLAGIFQAPDDIGRQLARPVALLAVPEDVEHQRREFERYLVIARQLVEQADVLDHQVHGEIDIAAAIQNHLRFGLVHERVARGDAD